MKVVLTGGTSLTGFWFARELKLQGHEVICLLTQDNAESYAHLKSATRFNLLSKEFEVHFSQRFGSENFLALLRKERPDVLCLHGSHIPDYKSQSFNLAESLQQNLFNLNEVFTILKEQNLPVVLTGTLFEPNEGGAGERTDAGSPYGLAKGLVTQAFHYYAKKFETHMSHFVIPNPFGIFEDKKFNFYLMDCWLKGQTARIKTPDYIRDNIPVSVLAKAYHQACVDVRQQTEIFKTYRPSGFVESQGRFTERMALEMRARLKFECKFELQIQSDFQEPLDRHNAENVFIAFPEFSLSDFWTQYANYYQKHHANLIFY